MIRRHELTPSAPALIDSMLEQSPTDGLQAAPPATISLVGDCLHDDHPGEPGRFYVSYSLPNGRRRERWLECLAGVDATIGDRVLLLCPLNADEPLIAGVVAAQRAPRGRTDGERTLVLKQQERLTVVNQRGERLMEIAPGDNGPVVMLGDQDLTLDVAGKLRLAAHELELCARGGEVRIEAEDDVCVRGQLIRLN